MTPTDDEGQRPADAKRDVSVALAYYEPFRDTGSGLRARLYVALVEQRVIDSRKYGEAAYAPITWAEVDALLAEYAPADDDGVV